MTEQQLPPGLALASGVAPAPGKRGPKPAYSVAQIVEAAVHLADADGFAAVSMPKIAKHLGITANALYRYVDSKEELLVLLAEAGWGPPPDVSSQEWRSACGTWVTAVIERFRVHPWLLDLPVRGAPVTPNLLRWLEVLLDSLAGTGLRDQDMLACAQLLDGYARSTAFYVRSLRESTAAPLQSFVDFLRPRLRDFPRVAALMAGGDYRDEEDEAPDLKGDIEFGLGCIFDGMDALILGMPQTHAPPVE